ncbi:sulfur transferase domain-containing protein [Gallaecimonas kandeliae]|uniref:beta-lactamase hydrolase domain-containing protein n=1 Tax=Gallaecimonas kandeliae TaxID=3029055 RepID=UPI002649AF86|nr:sulfur transferase domain-containing protein [Gallaecimonas kandeliae]WKE64270.1 sulfur transferase domain-containing protein [Gallaecimonas kandeliae]
MPLPVSYCHQVNDALFCAGLPTQAELEACQKKGIKTVINLTLPKEVSFDEEALVRSLGMAYHALPIAGPGDIDKARCERLKTLLEEAEGPVLLHCGTANRAGGMLAAMAYLCEGQDLESAMAAGRQGGMTKLEAPLRQCLCGGE